MCIGDSCCWGYTRFNPNWKTPVQLIQHLATAAAGEGNFLLNIGPGPDGRLRAEELERLSVMGDWLEKYGEAIRGSQRCELVGACTPDSVDLNLQGPWARKGKTGYWFCFRWPGPRATAVRVAAKPLKVTLLGDDDTAFPFSWDPETQRLVITGLPALPPDSNCTVLKVLFEEVPRRGEESDKSAWLALPRRTR